MNENEATGFEDFESALFADDYQTDSADDTEETETTEETAEDTTEETDADSEDESGDETDEEAHSGESEDEGSDQPDGGTNADQMFTLKVNKEERKVTLEEMTALAQKGDDYDRVKEQNAKNQQTIQQLQKKLDGAAGNQRVLDTLTVIAEKSGSTLEQLADNLFVNFRKSAGVSEETAREELKNAKLEKELNGFKAQQSQKQEQETNAEAQAQKELENFRKEYPDVELTEELVDKLAPDINSGMGLTAAYHKYEKTQDAARIAELERKLAAKEQNDKNKRRSPGSQQDSGGRRTKSDYEDFEKALFG